MQDKLAEEMREKLKGKSMNQKIRILENSLKERGLIDNPVDLDSEKNNDSYTPYYKEKSDIFNQDNFKKEPKIENKPKKSNKNKVFTFKVILLTIVTVYIINVTLDEMEGEGFIGRIFVLIFGIIYLGIIYKGSQRL